MYYDCVPCSPDLNCTRTDLDPCDYANMRLYALAVMCELNKFVNGCPDQWDCPLCGETEKCFELYTPQAFINAHPYGNVWEFCSDADCEGEYVCPVGTTYTIHHWYLTVSDQDILIAYLREVARLYKPNLGCCIKKIELYGKYAPITCSSNNPNFCTNYKIYVRIKYACNACD